MKKYIPAFICLLFLIGTAPLVFGETIPLVDNGLPYWAGWAAPGTSNKANYLNQTDYYTTPNISGGSALITNGYLTNVTLNVQSLNAALWSVIKPADLFIDINNDKYWDYAVNMITPSYGPGDQKLYAIHHLLGDPGYIMSNIDGYSVRDGHPVGIDLSGMNPDSIPVTFGGWSDPGLGNTLPVTFTFGNEALGLHGIPLEGSQFAIGWTVNCANDVFYEVLNHQVPEPTTLLLLGSGLIGLAVIKRKTFFAKQIG